MKTWAGLALLLAACGTRGGLDPANTVTPLTLEPPPIYSLLGYRSELSLESAQIARLDSLANWIRDENAPLIDSLRATSRQTRQERGVIEVDETNEALLETIRANNRRAGEAVAEVLTEEQRQAVCRLFERGRSAAVERRMERRRDRRGQPDAEAADSVTTRSGRLWPWCAPPSAAADTSSQGRR